jgi:cell division protein FtsI (penicillin-binding protein 3)
MKGIYFQKEFQRFYPQRRDRRAGARLRGPGRQRPRRSRAEIRLPLHGVPGRNVHRHGRAPHVLGSSEREPEPGQNLVLTIDENIQFLAERALDHAMERTQADNGTVVVQDVHTGQILALAIRPTFNPNNFRHTTSKLLK